MLSVLNNPSKDSILNAQQATITSLYLTHQKTLINILCRMVGCPQAAEDLAQETYIKVSDAAKNQHINYPQPFLYQTAKNLALDYLRKQKVRDRKTNLQTEEADLQDIADQAPTPDIAVQASEEVEELLKVLAEQPERRREMLILNRVHGWKYAEIGAHFGISKSAVEKNIRLALAHCLQAKSVHQ